MGVAPSRETIRRGFFNVNQVNTSSGGSGGNKRRDIVLIPLTKEYFPSPDCPLFVQFHKARCDAAVNYYFRRPGNPGDLSCIPNYESSYRLPGEETRAQRRRRRRLAREARAAEAAAHSSDVGEGPSTTRDRAGRGNSGDDSMEGDSDEDSNEDDSFPSREALYRGVIEHVEEALFDTDAEMRQAYQWALAHPHTTMGPDGKKQRKVLPVLCAVAFRTDISKVHNLNNVAAAAGSARLSLNTSSVPPPSPSSPLSSSSSAVNNMQAALESSVYMFGSIVNIVGCFGFVSMQEEVDDAQRLSQQCHQAGSLPAMSPPLLTPGSMQSHTPSGGGGTYHHDPYSFTSSQASSGSMAGSSNVPPMTTATSGGTLLSARGSGRKGARHVAQIGAATDLITLPPPVAAPLAAMVFLTKSAGEQNLGRVTHIAASTYYYQLIQAGLIERRPGVRMEGPNVYSTPTSATAPSSQPPYGSGAVRRGVGGSNNHHNSAGSTAPAPPPPPMYSATSPSSHPAGSSAASLAHHDAPKPFLPPMETFSFSSLLTNIPVLSFLYEMKWRWGYLGVLKAGTPTASTSRNGSFNGSMSMHPMDGNTTARGPGSMMGNHSTGGLAAIDSSVGQGVTDELEMWITADQMIHGRISRDLAQRLCWSLAERPEVMQERISQLPSEETGYWRYRGLADQTRLPPVPEPGKVVTIHPKDVYVMGSDVLPGFNEGDILRFDPERLVWFADHSIPLEGLVLAAMRPYCKQAREADPEDPSWVTTVCDVTEAEALQAGEMDIFYPTPPPTVEEAALLASDSDLVHIHEHVGNFYVYRFVRDGTTYHYGTVPNFANMNKKKQLPNAADASSHGAAANTAGNSVNDAAATVAHSADSVGGAPASAAAKTTPNANNTASTAGANSSSNKPTVPVPKTIASALFSLLPASRAAQGKSSGGANTAGMNGGTHTSPSGAAKNCTSGGAWTASTVNTGSPLNAAAPSTTAYLATPVTSKAVNTARRWVQALYSYAYGAPNTAAATERRLGPNAASLPAGAGGPPAGAGVSSGRPPAGSLSAPSRATAAVPPLRIVVGDSVSVSGSCPCSPGPILRVDAKTPTTGVAKITATTACDVAVWPAPTFIGQLSHGKYPQLIPDSFAAGMVDCDAPGMGSPGTSKLASHHSSSSWHPLMRHGSGHPGEDGLPTMTSKPIKRYVEDGSYEWDWRKQ